MDFPGLKDKIIFGMGGYGGNMILIDAENSRILVVNSLHYNNGQYKYNHKKLETKLEIFEINQIDLWFMIELPRHQICYHANAK